MDEAKESAEVDVLTDVTIDEYTGYYLLFSNQCIRIEGKGVPRDLLSSYESSVLPQAQYESQPAYHLQ